MIEALKSGRFKLCALIHRRLVQLLDGARPLVERNGRSDLEVVIEEIFQEKITIEPAPEESATAPALTAGISTDMG